MLMRRWMGVIAITAGLLLPSAGIAAALAGAPDGEAAVSLMGHINGYRAAHGLASLRRNDALAAIALERSQDMGMRNRLSHTIPPGDRYFEDLLAEAAIPYA